MSQSLVRDAHEAFKQGDYKGALGIYHHLSESIGEKYFGANIQICLNRIRRTSSHKQVFFLKKENCKFIPLRNTAIAVKINISGESAIKFFGSVEYSNIKEYRHPKALVSVRFFDGDGKPINGAFRGLSKSEKYGDFHYLKNTECINKNIFTLYPPKDAVCAQINVSAFCLQPGEAVTISNKIEYEFCTTDYELSDVSKEAIEIFGWPPFVENGKIRVMSIFDEFSRECFAPHANLIEPRPDNAVPLLKRDKPEILFVESTWRGNKSTWQYRVAKYAHPPGNELSDLVSECKRSRIPTIFWNKEDPVHFDNFIHAAKSFDYIFTTAEEAIPKYQEHSSAIIHALPFAAEASLHNPIGSARRNNRICFAGSYYANRFKERRDDQLMLLDAASSFNLDIFDRNADAVSKDFCFPERFNPFIRGKLPYAKMNKAYREYRVFLNVNSVIDSKTMFSRRVFELLACGTPIISTVSTGIDHMFGQELVLTVRDRGEAEEAIRYLMRDDMEWRRRSIQGIRCVFSKHTFAHRFDEVLRIAGVPSDILPRHRVILVGEVSNTADAEMLIETQARQALVNTETKLILLSNNSSVQIQKTNIKTISHTGALKNILIREAKDWNASHFGLLDAQAVYGKFYLQDALNAFGYADCVIVGKPNNGIDAYDYSEQLAIGSFLIKSSYLQSINSHAANIIELERSSLDGLKGMKAFSADAANYINREQATKYANLTNVLHSIEI